MPRLDNSSEKVIKRFDLDFNPDDPGKTRTLDFCADCWLSEIVARVWEEMENDHPDYEEGNYYCFICGGPLLASDNKY